MKNFLLKSLMVAVIASTIVACEKDDSSSTSSGTIVGTWEATSSRSIEKLNGQTVVDSTETYAANQLVVTFNANGTIYSNDNGTIDTSNYVLNGNQLLLIDNDPVFGIDTISFTATITSTNLKLFEEYSEVYQGVTYSDSYEMNFKKK